MVNLHKQVFLIKAPAQVIPWCCAGRVQRSCVFKWDRSGVVWQFIYWISKDLSAEWLVRQMTWILKPPQRVDFWNVRNEVVECWRGVRLWKYTSQCCALTLIGDLQGEKLQGTCTVDLGLKTFENSKTFYFFLMLFGSNVNKTSDGTENLFFMESAVPFIDT